MLQRLLLVVSLLSPLVASAHADEIKIPGGRFEAKDAADGEAFEAKGWEVKGGVRRVDLGDRGFGIALRPGARLARELEAAELAPPKGAKYSVDVKRWTAILSADVSLRPGRSKSDGKAILRVKLWREGKGGSFSEQIVVVENGWVQRLVLAFPAEELEAGTWRVEVAAMGRAGFLVDDLALYRVPTHPDEMRFAKPNGKNGPDRLESGVFGFAAHTANEHWPLPVKAVRPGGPAEKGGMAPGDVVVAVADRPLPRSQARPGRAWFEHGHEAILGRTAEATFAGQGARVPFTVLRGGKLRRLELKPAQRPALPEAFPFDDEVTPEFYDDLVEFVLRTRRGEQKRWANGGNDWIQTSFAGLALLGRRDPAHAEIIRETADWFLEKFPEPESFGNLGFWSAAYAGIFMTEYLFATGDERVRPWIEDALRWVEAGFHTSKWGTPALGHGPTGLPYGNKALMAPATHVIVFEALAQRLGFRSQIFERLWPYMLHSWSDPKEQGHGAMGYNGSYRDKAEFWSRTGLFILACRLRGERRTRVMEEACARVMAERHPWMRNSHAYGNPGDVWGLVGLHMGNRAHFEDVMAEWRWAFGGAWQPGYGLRHTTAHMGSPYMGGEGLVNPAVAMLLSVRDGGLVITGAKMQDAGWLELPPRDAAAAVSIGCTADGRVTLVSTSVDTPIHYTVDGSTPTRRSPRYEEPFALPDGGLVRAVAVARRTPGRVARRAVGLPKSAWRVVDANGAPGKEAALERARRLVDGDPRSPWQPDRGEGSHGFPFEITLDLGAVQSFSGLAFSGRNLPTVVRVTRALTRDGLDAAPRDFRLDEKGVARFEELVSARWLHVAITEVRKGKKPRFGEMGLAYPAITTQRDGSSLAVTMDSDELVLRYTTTGKSPTRSARKVTGKIKPIEGKSVQLRRFDASGRPVGPVVFVE